jgi:hypothetical protein
LTGSIVLPNAQGKKPAKAASAAKDIGSLAASSAMGGKKSGKKVVDIPRQIRMGGGGGRGLAIAFDPPEEFSSLMLDSATLPYQLSLPLFDRPTLQCLLPKPWQLQNAAVAFVPFQVHTLTAPHILHLIF